MFSDAYRGVKYFGVWAEETADTFGRRDALAVLQDAVDRCADEDMRTDQVAAALVFLAASATRQGAFRAFRVGLDLHDPTDRSRALFSALVLIRQILGTAEVAS